MGKLLIVDDEIAIGTLLTRLFHLAGHQADHVNSGEKALSYLQQEMPDLLILDIMMPGMNGYEVLRRIRADQRMASLSVVIYTGISDSQAHEDLLRMGANDTISKASMDFDQMMTRIAKYFPAVT